jgi:hypothetical protein
MARRPAVSASLTKINALSAHRQMIGSSIQGVHMTNGEALYLALVLAGFAVFSVTLAVVSHESGARQEAARPAPARARGERHAH